MTDKDVCVVISASGNPKYLLGVLEKLMKLEPQQLRLPATQKEKLQKMQDTLFVQKLDLKSLQVQAD